MNISLKIGLTQKLTQTLKMTPEMQLAIKILQLNSQEMKGQILELLETNPVVELDEKKSKTSDIPLEKMSEGNIEAAPISREFKEESREDFGIDWQKYLQDSENSEFRVSSGAYSKDDETTFENFVSKKENLPEYLLSQLHESNLNGTQTKIGEYLIGLTDRNGYLRHSREEISELLKVSPDVVEHVVNAIQAMNPPGIGAYDLKECLMLQALEEGYHNDAVTTIIQSYLPEVAKNKLMIIAKEAGLQIDEVQDAVEIIKAFNPKPGASFPSARDEIYVTPDVFITKVGEEYVVSLNEREMPRLRINKMYRQAMKHKDQTDKETYNFIRNKLDSARSFLRYVDKRKETILNVTKGICEVQRGFFDNGILHLKPLTLQDIAGMTEMHESTVSRATSGKYAQTPRGLFELKFFFSGAARTQSGEDVSTLAVKQRLHDLVSQEDQKKPLSDSEIVELLKTDGIYIARRTVAKYRTELNIPSSSTRKRHA